MGTHDVGSAPTPFPVPAERPKRDVAGFGLIAGPAAFITAWIVGGQAMPEPYSPIHDAISRIAAVHSPEQGLMTAGFLTYAVAVGGGAAAMRRSRLRPAWPLVALNAAATLAVACLPLEHSSSMDTLHAVAAGTGYVSISLAPLVAAPALRRAGLGSVARFSTAVGLVSGVCLATTVATDWAGLFQRVGLSVGDVWLILMGAALASGSPALLGPDQPDDELGDGDLAVG